MVLALWVEMDEQLERLSWSFLLFSPYTINNKVEVDIGVGRNHH